MCGELYIGDERQQYCGDRDDKTSCRYKRKQYRDKKFVPIKKAKRNSSIEEKLKYRIKMRNLLRKYKNIKPENYRK